MSKIFHDDSSPPSHLIPKRSPFFLKHGFPSPNGPKVFSNQRIPCLPPLNLGTKRTTIEARNLISCRVGRGLTGYRGIGGGGGVPEEASLGGLDSAPKCHAN